jgi:hypothetical protein
MSNLYSITTSQAVSTDTSETCSCPECFRYPAVARIDDGYSNFMPPVLRCG